jgi:acyl-CoA thioesterase
MAHAESDTAARAAERTFFGLEMDDGARRGTLPVAERVRTPDGRLYGGAMLGVAVAAMETATMRRVVWATTQFVASAPHGARLEVEVEELARGGRTSQVLVRASTSDGAMFSALGATGEGRDDGFVASYLAMPRVPAPVDCPPLLPPAVGEERGYKTVTDIRAAGEIGAGNDGDGRPPALLIWASTPGYRTTMPAMMALLADHLPLTLARLAGLEGAGASLDNTVRVGPRAEHDWVLLECLPELGDGGYGHGTVHLWSPDGRLLAVGSQSSGMRSFANWKGAPTRSS